MEEILASKALHQIKSRSYDGKIVVRDTTLYGVTVNAHYNINELWKFSDLMRFDLANIEGDSGGAATAYEVMLKKKEIPNEHGEFSITGAINVEGNISSVGGVKAKTYLAIKNSVPVMFVPKGVNYSEAIEMKSLMKSNIDIVPIQKLGDIEAYWK
ncbi:S16 family serine protease [Paenibacillus sp. UMB7766-LJ446]|uniref:S16 family serine protease n=1 Tax=Paenibacillus sp. UMB7766-LJ446 TaxID=3046313 RepID=UPI0025512EE9|nr:S16 family serine protease [Paenibacillus sp. UMB7766-LJ446]MDK8193064.1 S16 family serine protease [Paenibacillus sp. UMB7766-LJ446]